MQNAKDYTANELSKILNAYKLRTPTIKNYRVASDDDIVFEICITNTGETRLVMYIRPAIYSKQWQQLKEVIDDCLAMAFFPSVEMACEALEADDVDWLSSDFSL